MEWWWTFVGLTLFDCGSKNINAKFVARVHEKMGGGRYCWISDLLLLNYFMGNSKERLFRGGRMLFDVQVVADRMGVADPSFSFTPWKKVPYKILFPTSSSSPSISITQLCVVSPGQLYIIFFFLDSSRTTFSRILLKNLLKSWSFKDLRPLLLAVVVVALLLS